MPERRKSYPIFRPKGFGNLEIIKEVIGIESGKIFGNLATKTILGKLYLHSDGPT